MQIDFILSLLCFTLTSQGWKYLMSIFTLHEQLNNFVRNLTTTNIAGIEYHNNSESLGWSSKVIGCKTKVIHELDGNFVKRGASSTSIEIANYTLKGVCQSSVGWLAYYTKTAAPYTTYYKFALWADNFASKTEYDLTTESGFLNVIGGYLFSYDGTCAYFKQNDTSGQSILKVNLSTSITETLPIEQYIMHGTTKYTYSDHIISDGTNVYYFDELQLDYWNRTFTYQNASGKSNSQLFYFDGTYFYFPYGVIRSGGLYAGVPTHNLTNVNLIAKKIV